MTLDLVHPRTAADVAEIVRAAGASGSRLLVVGGRHHVDKGNPSEVDAELWTTQLDELVAYDPAEMLVVVQAGMRVGDLQAVLADGGQEWPVDVADEATVGGVIAAGVTSPRRLRVGSVRDSVVELTAVIGDGRTIASGARTVKNVSGYDVHRLMTGSLGTLGVIVQVALKVRPLPPSRRVLRTRVGGLAHATDLLARIRPSAAVIAEPNAVIACLEGWPDEVDGQLAELGQVTDAELLEGLPEMLARRDDGNTVLEIAVPPSRLGSVVDGEDTWQALADVGIAWVGISTPEAMTRVRTAATAAGGIAPAIRGPGGLGASPLHAADVQRRLKEAFDPARIFAPGRFWGGS